MDHPDCPGAVRSEGYRDVPPLAGGDQEECPQPHHLIKDIRTIVDTHKVDIYITLYDITLHYVTGRLPGQVRDGQAAAELARPRQRQEEEAGRRQEGQRGQHRQGETLSFNSFLHNLLAPD